MCVPANIGLGLLAVMACVGTTAEGEIALHLPKAGGWAVKQIEPGSPELRVANQPDSPPGVLRYTVSQRIATAGEQRADVHFLLSGPDGKPLRVKTEVMSYGLADTK